MARSKINMDVVKQVRSKLESREMFNPESMSALSEKLKLQRKSLSCFSFTKKRELDLTISALTYLLDKKKNKN
ncbi:MULTISPECIES: hypothetical protein [unclassified Croceitalea]|uniref:hypothetical protein n=1 Tax=unclassified Croceitalea TaxID=2632280 RepID=UPI0030DC3427